MSKYSKAEIRRMARVVLSAKRHNVQQYIIFVSNMVYQTRTSADFIEDMIMRLASE